MKASELDALEVRLAAATAALQTAKAPAAMRRRVEDAMLAVNWLRANTVKRKP